MLFFKIGLVLLGIVVALTKLAGIRAFRIVLQSWAFILSRPWVVFVAASSSVLFGRYMWNSALELGNEPSLVLVIGISLVVGIGAAALVVPPIFMLRRLSLQEPEVPDDAIVWKANHVFRRESRQGQLVYHDLSLRFLPGRFAVQQEPWVLTFDDVADARSEGTRLLVLVDADQSEHEFILADAAQVAQVTRREVHGEEAPIEE